MDVSMEVLVWFECLKSVVEVGLICGSGEAYSNVAMPSVEGGVAG